MSTSAKYPFITTRMIQMLDQFADENYLDLMQTIWKFAVEDLDASKRKVTGKTLGNSMRKLLEDKRGPQHAFQLLLSMPAPVVKACIKGNFGSQYHIDPEFGRNLYTMTLTHGIYLYTFTVKRTDDSKNSTLTRNEMVELVAMMKRYRDTKGIRGEEEARKIENAYNYSTGFEAFHEGTRDLLGGYRGKKIDVLCKTLLERWHPHEDPSGNERQFQGPCGVGYSDTLATRAARPFSDDLSSSTYPWVLAVSCLKVMGVDIERISVPVLKVWDHDQRELGEILVTMLASSLIEDGGFNPTQAGYSNGGRTERGYDREDIEVFVEKDVIGRNVDNSEELILERKAIVANLLPLMDDSYLAEASDKSTALKLQALEIMNRKADIDEGIQKAKVDLAEVKKTKGIEGSRAGISSGTR